MAQQPNRPVGRPPTHGHYAQMNRAAYGTPPTTSYGAARPPLTTNRTAPQPAPAQRMMPMQIQASYMKLHKVLNGEPTYLEPGPNNRLVMSLRSGIPSEVDFALERLIQSSSIDPEMSPFHLLPALPSALLDLIELEVVARRASRVVNTESVDRCRQSIEAGLVLRNLGTQFPPHKEQLVRIKRLPRIIADVLDIEASYTPSHRLLSSRSGELNELKLYLLEILETCCAPPHPTAQRQEQFLRLFPPFVPSPPRDEDEEEEEEEEDPASDIPPDDGRRRLFPAVVQCLRSPDRALVIAAFRVLAVLAGSEAHLPLFDLPLADPIVDRAVELLALEDAEMLLAVLDFLYQYSALPGSASRLCARTDFGPISKFLVAMLHRTGVREDWEVDIRPQLRRRERDAGMALPGSKAPPGTKLSAEVQNRLLVLPEPQRTISWMQHVYEEDPEGEVTQVALWTAYKEEWERFEATFRMLPAADVIKHSTDAYPKALPMVTGVEDKRFIIKGIRLRNRKDLGEVFRCRWSGCMTPKGTWTSDDLFQHLMVDHIYKDPTPIACSWLNCAYHTPLLDGNTAKRTAALALHVRTHIPSPTATTTKAQTPPPVAAKYLREVVRYSTYTPTADEQGHAIGLAFLAGIILRNLARAITAAFNAQSSEIDVDEADLDENGNKRPSLFVLLSGDGVSSSVPTTGPSTLALRGKDAFCAVEADLVHVLMTNRLLSPYAAEVLEAITLVKGKKVAKAKGPWLKLPPGGPPPLALPKTL